MNVIIIHSHDTGRYLEPYRKECSSPNLMTFAQMNNTVVFRQAFSCAPTCSPSRASMMSGLYPHEVGMTGLAHRGFTFSPFNRHLAAIMKKLGLRTILSGIQHETSDWRSLGYEEYLGANPEAPYKKGFNSVSWDKEHSDRVVNFLRKNAESQSPFFLFWGLFNPHRPYPVSSKQSKQKTPYAILPEGIPSCSGTGRDMAGYLKSLEYADMQIGRVLEVLKASGRFEDSLIIYTTDHGIAFPGHKCTLSDRGTGVALMIRPPDRVMGDMVVPSRDCDLLVSHLDLVPTILDMTDSNMEYSGDGVSLKNLLTGTNSMLELTKRNLYSEISYHAAYEPCRAIRTEKYKLIRYFESPEPVFSNFDESPSKDEYFSLPRDTRPFVRDKLQFFDLSKDPEEKINLINNSKYKSMKEDLNLKLDEWMKRTGDPLCHGTVTAPDGAVVDCRDAGSPT